MIQSLKQYSGRPLQEYGTLVKDGDFVYRVDLPREKLKPRYVFLFSNAIVICKSKVCFHLYLPDLAHFIRQGVFYHFKTLVELDSESEVADFPFWKLPKEEQTSAKV